jgi:hypothetical protein
VKVSGEIASRAVRRGIDDKIEFAAPHVPQVAAGIKSETAAQFAERTGVVPEDGALDKRKDWKLAPKGSDA